MARLDEIFDLQMGKTPSRNNADYWIDGQYDWVSIADLGTYQKYVDETKEKISALAVQESGIKSVPANTVIMSFKLSLGKTAITQEPIYTNEAIMAFIPTRKYEVLPDYFYHLFSAKDWTKGTNRAVMGTTLNKATLGSFSITVPSLTEQRKIAAVLDKVSGLIAKRRQQLEKLDEMVKARFVEMFYNTTGNANWPIVTMADISTDMRTGPFGSALHHDEFVETGIFVLGIDNAVENRFSYNRMRYITEEKYEQLKRYTVRPGDVIITIMGTVGRSAVIPDNIPKAINTKHLACLTIDRSKAQPTFICSAFQMHPEIRQQLTGQAKGAIMDGLNLTIIKKLCFKLPPIEIQNKFVEFFNLTENTKTIISRSLEKLETLKKALMQEYFG
ncbi:restriction endonuclease subunit S [Hydrogeniiclostridium mannosilyticum]|uniref:restriction endonuclease subunit S n=1 Tax=Hydrogeniiclostridium mannosilyticum TaxID=2764322 RepID=UPI00399BA7DC